MLMTPWHTAIGRGQLLEATEVLETFTKEEGKRLVNTLISYDDPSVHPQMYVDAYRRVVIEGTFSSNSKSNIPHNGNGNGKDMEDDPLRDDTCNVPYPLNNTYHDHENSEDEDTMQNKELALDICTANKEDTTEIGSHAKDEMHGSDTNGKGETHKQCDSKSDDEAGVHDDSDENRRQSSDCTDAYDCQDETEIINTKCQDYPTIVVKAQANQIHEEGDNVENCSDVGHSKEDNEECNMQYNHLSEKSNACETFITSTNGNNSNCKNMIQAAVGDTGQFDEQQNTALNDITSLVQGTTEANVHADTLAGTNFIPGIQMTASGKELGSSADPNNQTSMKFSTLALGVKFLTANVISTPLFPWKGDHRWKNSMLRFPTCLSLALASGNPDLVDVILDAGADPRLQDDDGNNCFHHLVLLAKHDTPRAVVMYQKLCETFGDAELKDLLHTRNQKGLKPLDLAAKLFQLNMMQAIISTLNVYKFIVAELPLSRCVAYDVSDYEGTASKTRESLLYSLTELTEEEVKVANEIGLLHNEPFCSWSKSKIEAYSGTIKFFIVFWCVFVAMYYAKIVTYSYGYIVPPLEVALGTFALTYLLSELAHIKADSKQVWQSIRSYIRFERIPVTFTLGYRLFQIFFSMFILITTFAQGIVCEQSAALQGLHVFNSLLSVLSLLFFLQLNTRIGHILLIAQKMLTEVLFFFCTIALIFLGFSLGFFLMHKEPSFSDRCPSDNTNITFFEQDDDLFEGFPGSMYETFLLMLTIMPPNDIYFSTSPLPGFVITLYIILIIVVSIVMVNLLIAIMATRLDDIYQWRYDIKSLEDLAIILYFEQRMNTKVGIFMRNIRRKFPCCNKVQDSQFKCKNVEDKVYVEVLEDCLESF